APALAVAHHRAAVSLEAMGDAAVPPAELAFHYARSGDPRGWRLAVHYYEAAAQRARALLAPEEAVRHYEQAMTLVTRLPNLDDTTRCDLVLGLAEARFRAGQRPASREAFAAAASLAPRLDPE